jgi:hypothetical protein
VEAPQISLINADPSSGFIREYPSDPRFKVPLHDPAGVGAPGYSALL